MATGAHESLGAGVPGVKATDLSAVIAELANLDGLTLQRRWRSIMGRPMPDGMGRSLILRILTYHLQSRHYGDLDRASAQALASLISDSDDDPPGNTEIDGSSEPKPRRIAEMPRILRPGTILTREHNGAMHRVMVLDQGFAWNGKTYASLSVLAFAITGTRWNGRRFFGILGKGGRAGGGRNARNSISSPSSAADRPECVSTVGGAS